MLTTDERTELMALMPTLESGASQGAFTAWVGQRLDACLAELLEAGGHEAARAALLRGLELWLTDPSEQARVIEAVTADLAAYPAWVAQADGSDHLRRHPTWVAIAGLELHRRKGDADPVEAALALCETGFARLPGAFARGELLWALAEKYEECGWTAQADRLWTLAVEAPFADDEHRWQVRFLRGVSLVERDDREGERWLAEVAESEDAAEQTRVHADWILAVRAREQGATDRAIARLDHALTLLDPVDDVDVRDKVELLRAAVARHAPGAS